jgi:mannose-6-phosphate isomerase-like protein (cupin superfamily)
METRDLRDFVHFDPAGPTVTEVFETGRVWSQVVCLEGNQQIGPIGDPHSDAVFVIVAGKVVFQVDRRRTRLSQWETGLVPAGAEVTVTNASEEPAVVFVVAAPPPAPSEPSPEAPPQG